MRLAGVPALPIGLTAAIILQSGAAGAWQNEAPPAPPATAPTQEGQGQGMPTIRIVGAARPKIPIALPAFTAKGGDSRLQETTRTIREVVRQDLDFSGYFAIVPEEYHKLIRDAGDGRVNHKEWLGIGAEALLLAQARFEPATIVFEGQLFDTTDQKTLLHKRYRGELDQSRDLAHKLSNEIILQFTGQEGVARSRIAYVSQVGKAKEIFVMDYDGSRAKKITSNASINLSPAWSPGGQQIAFLSYRSGSPELVILSSDGALRKAFPQQGELNSAPAWSPDGRFLALASSRDGNTEIYTLRVADGTLTRLTNNAAIDTSPAWSPDGRQIAFTSDRTGTPQIYVMDADGGGARRLTYEVSYCDAASWSAVGDKVKGKIAFTARVPGGFDIYVQDLDTGQLSRLTENSNINEWPRWSADGRHLAFASNRTGNFDIYTMDADGSRVRRLTHGGNSHSPSWSR